MADNSVFITGTTSGAFTDAFSDLPPWATERTALAIEKHLRRSFDVQSKIFDALKKLPTSNTGGKMSSDDVKKVNDELADLAKNLKKNNDEAEKQRKESLGSGLSTLATMGNKLVGVGKDYINVYDSLYKSGINLLNGNNSTIDGFESLNQVVNLTGLRLETLQKVAEKYASTINVVGFNKFARSISIANNRLTELGYSSEEQANLIGTLLQAETGYVTTRNKSSDEIAKDAIRLGERFDRLVKTVGMTRDQLSENLKSTAESSDAAMIFARFGKEAAAAVSENAAGIKDSGLRDMLVELAAAANPAQVKGYNVLVQAGLGDVAEQMNQLSKGMMALDPVEFQKRIASLGQYLEQQTGRMGSLANLKGQGGDEAASALNAVFQQARSVSDATRDQADSARKTQASIAKLQTEIESFSATLQKAFFPLTDQVNIAASAFGILNSNIDRAIAAFEAETRSLVGFGIAVAGLIASIALASGAMGRFSIDASKSGGLLGSSIMNVGGAFMRLLGPVALLYTAFQVGTAIGETLYEMFTGLKATGGYLKAISDMFPELSGSLKRIVDWIKEFASKLGAKVVNKLSFGILGSENSATSGASSTVSVPKSPAGSTVLSPSTQPSNVDGSTGNATMPTSTASAVPPTGIKKPDSNADINSLLRHQGALLEQLLLSTNTLVSVNKDILRYSRNSA